MRRIIFFVIYQLSNSTLPPERHPGESSLHCAFLTSAQNPLSRIAKRGCTRNVVVDTHRYCGRWQAHPHTLIQKPNQTDSGSLHHGTTHPNTFNHTEQAKPTNKFTQQCARKEIDRHRCTCPQEHRCVEYHVLHAKLIYGHLHRLPERSNTPRYHWCESVCVYLCPICIFVFSFFFSS